MLVKIANIEFEIENSPSGVAEMFERIDAALEELEVYLSHLLLDGVPAPDNFREYLESNFAAVKMVEVIFLTSDQYLQRVVGIVEDFLQKVSPIIGEVAEEFYGKPDDSTWERFAMVMQGLQSLVEIINGVIGIPAFSGKIQEFDEIGVKVGEELLNLKDAAERDDMTLVADIMNFELVPFVDSLHGAIKRLQEGQATTTH